MRRILIPLLLILALAQTVAAQTVENFPSPLENRATLSRATTLGGFPGGVVFNGDALYVGQGRNLVTYDVSDIANPQQVNSADGGMFDLTDFIVDGNTLYATNGDLAIFDIINPLQPTLTANVPTPNFTRCLQKHGDTLYLLADNTLQVWDVSGAPQLLRRVTLLNAGVEMTIHNLRLYVTIGFDGVLIFDLADPADPQQIKQIDTAARSQAVAVVNPNGQPQKTMMVLAQRNANFEVFDITDLDNIPPTTTSSEIAVNSPGDIYLSRVDGTRLYFTDTAGAVHVFTFDENFQPTLQQSMTIPGGVLRLASAESAEAQLVTVALLGTLGPLTLARIDTDTIFSSVQWPYFNGDIVIQQSPSRTIGDLLFSQDDNTLYAYDISNPMQPILTGTVGTIFASNVAVGDDYAYSLPYFAGAMSVVDISNPANMSNVNTVLTTGSETIDGLVRDDTLYVLTKNGGGDGQLETFDLSDPVNPSADPITPFPGPTAVTADLGQLFVGDAMSGTVVYSDTMHVTSFSPYTDTATVKDFTVIDNTLYIASDDGMMSYIEQVALPVTPASMPQLVTTTYGQVYDLYGKDGKLALTTRPAVLNPRPNSGGVTIWDSNTYDILAQFFSNTIYDTHFVVSNGVTYVVINNRSYAIDIFTLDNPTQLLCQNVPQSCLKTVSCPTPKPGYELAGKKHTRNGQTVTQFGTQTAADYTYRDSCNVFDGGARCLGETLTCTYQAINGAEPDFTPQLLSGADLGDAPDSSNSIGGAMTAYVGVAAAFPTVYETGSPPFGAYHKNDSFAYAWLGASYSGETEADSGTDTDGVFNIDVTGDSADLDSDDGLVEPLTLNHCRPSTVQVVVTIPYSVPSAFWYLNGWFDWDRNGQWGEIADCGAAGDAPEWAVNNQMLGNLGAGTHIIELPVLAYRPDPDAPLWVRVTLSNSLAENADGSGPADGYDFGETEDYYVTDFTPFSSGTLNPTDSYEQTFERIGNYPFYDGENSAETGTIRVRPAASSRATVEVAITASGFVSDFITIAPGDTVRWVNSDSAPHSVEGGTPTGTPTAVNGMTISAERSRTLLWLIPFTLTLTALYWRRRFHGASVA